MCARCADRRRQSTRRRMTTVRKTLCALCTAMPTRRCGSAWGVGEDERVEQRGRDLPRHVQVVEGEQHAVRQPVPPPNAPFIRGSSNPRNSNSSPSTVLKTNIATTSAEPRPVAVQELRARRAKRGRSRGRGPRGAEQRHELLGGQNATTRGSTTSHTRPPRRPVLGLRGARSHSASRDRPAQRPLFPPTRSSTSTNCQTSPAGQADEHRLAQRRRP